MIYKPGFKTLISQIYVPDDEHLDSDVQFGVTRALIGNYIRHDEPAPAMGFAAPWYSLDQRFVLQRGRGASPQAADPLQGAGLTLRPERPRQQGLDGGVDGELALDDGVHGLRDRHVDGLLGRATRATAAAV